MQHVVSFSTGLSSALTAERVLERYGAAATSIVFMDTLVEDEDNYRFRDEVYQRWRDVYGVTEYVTLVEGRTPLQVSEDRNIIPNQRRAPCTYKLKIDPFVAWLKEQEGPLTVHIGFDYQEIHRCEATRNNYEKRGYLVDFPLLWQPYETRPYTDVAREDWGIEPPRMYAMGYTHANCGGVCVKQGWGDWLRTLANFPERYAAYEAWETQMRDHPVRQNYAFLRDQSNGMVRPKTLRQLREEQNNRQELNLPLFDFNGGCVHCGVGDLGIAEEEE